MTFYRKENRTTTYESLKAAVIMMTTDSEEEYCRAYRVATHDEGGHMSWYIMQHVRIKEK